ncbi:hypothetical protein EIN_484860, partial [Entamoeba invadens IP1]
MSAEEMTPVEIPTNLTDDLFQPLIQHNTSLTNLPQDTLRMITSNLDFDSFVKLSSTCRALNQYTNDPVVMRSVCGLSGSQSCTECENVIRKRKRDIKNEKERRAAEKLRRREIFQTEFFMCNRRCSSNVFFEFIALAFLFVAMVMGPLSLDRSISVPLSSVGWVLLFPALYYGFFPHFLWCWGCFTQTEKDMIDDNRDMKIYGGAYDYFNQLFLWSNQSGFRPLKWSVLIITYVLFMIWCYDIFDFGYVLLPVTLYCLLYPCIGTI